jgi:hypothetical protein
MSNVKKPVKPINYKVELAKSKRQIHALKKKKWEIIYEYDGLIKKIRHLIDLSIGAISDKLRD